MSQNQLVPCPGCARHVRLAEATCPFCNSSLDSSVLAARYAPRRAAVPGGIKRAALMALGTSVAAACGGKTGGTGEDVLPIAASESTTDEAPSVIAICGAPVAPSSSEPAASTTGEPATTTTREPLPSTDEDSTWNAVPPYGFPPSTLPSTNEPTEPPGGTSSDTDVNTVPPDAAGDAGADAAIDAAATGEVDGGVDEPSTVADDLTDLAQPEYGAPIPE